ncbi:MAG: hypothetical protein ACTSYZ_03185 [Candidatus Helarchaeota archaeon]
MVRIIKSLDDISSIKIKREPDNCPVALKKIKITDNALKKLFLMAKAVNEHLGGYYEVYCLLLGEDDIIEDIYIPEQEAGTTSVNVSEDNLIKIINNIDSLEITKKILGWGHSHGNFSVFSSYTDDQNHLTILNQTSNFVKINNQEIKFAYGLTVNVKKEIFGIVISQYTCGAIFQRKGNFIYLRNQDSFDEFSEYNNILDIVKKRVRKYNWDLILPKRKKLIDYLNNENELDILHKGNISINDPVFTDNKSTNYEIVFKKIDLYTLQDLLSSDRITEMLLNYNLFKQIAIEFGEEKFRVSLYSIINVIRNQIMHEIIELSQ